MLQQTLPLLAVAGAALALSACGGMRTGASAAGTNAGMYDQSSLPDGVRVPAGHRVAMEAVGVGGITYECRAKADTAGAYEWFLLGPRAVLRDRSGKTLGTYYGPPATWESSDGSKLAGAQVAVAPAATGNIPMQLVKANPATGTGAMNGVSYIQRVATRGGVAPSVPCAAGNVGARQMVEYQADYIFYKPV